MIISSVARASCPLTEVSLHARSLHTVCALLGGLALVLETPLTAAILVLVKMLYVGNRLGDTIPVQGDPRKAAQESKTI